MKTVEYDIIALPEIAIIGKEGLCTKEKNVAKELPSTGQNKLFSPVVC